jgi:hypothetical protein
MTAQPVNDRTQRQLERELRDTIKLQQYGTLARVYGCTSHERSTIDSRYCRKCWTPLEGDEQ